MGILGQKDKANSSPAEEASKEARRKHIELLGREFSIVRDGLEPKEVLEFLEASVGSSEAAFKHLEQFSAFQSIARTMDESIREAKQLAEQAKAKARLEADHERARAIAEMQSQSSAILDETMRSCIASVEGIHSVILDAVARTEEILQEAFGKTREMVAADIARIQQDMQAIVDGKYQRAEPENGAGEDSLELPAEPEDAINFDEAGDEEAGEGPVFDLANLQESLMSLELSLSSLNESKNAFGPTPGTQVDVFEKDEGEKEEEDEGQAEEEQPAVVEGHDDQRQDIVRQYSGDVNVQIVGGAEESWMQQLRKRMLELPGARIRAESGVDEKTTMVSLSLAEPVGLFPILLSLPRVDRVVPGRLNGEKEGARLKLWSKSDKKSAQHTITVELHGNGQAKSAVAESEDDPITAG